MTHYYIGWDVGAWKCTKGRNDSCDALIVMDDNRIVGHHRANLAETFQRLSDAHVSERPATLINHWFELCVGEVQGTKYSADDQYYIAIDTPLGWPKDFHTLFNLQVGCELKHNLSAANLENSLLYRYTERKKLNSGLSVIVDSIGSQSTKGILLLRLLCTTNDSWGIWRAGNITLIETYPKACLVRQGFVEWMVGLSFTQDIAEIFRVQICDKPKRYGPKRLIAEDTFDAGVCACVAKAFARQSPRLVSPTPNDPSEYFAEGWIFFPDHGQEFVKQSIADGHTVETCKSGVATFHDAIQTFKQYLVSRSR